MRFIPIILLMGMLISTAHSQTEDWQDFRSLEGKFSILFPGEPQLKVDTISTAVGPLAYHTYLYQTQDTTADNLVYLLSYCEYPEGTFHKDSTSLIDEFFEVTIDASVEAVHGELAYHTERNYRSHPGRFWRINYRSGNAVLKTRAFLVGQRYYSVQVATIRPRSLNTAGDRFMDSVRVIEEAQP